MSGHVDEYALSTDLGTLAHQAALDIEGGSSRKEALDAALRRADAWVKAASKGDRAHAMRARELITILLSDGERP